MEIQRELREDLRSGTVPMGESRHRVRMERGRSRAPVAVLALTAFGVSSAWLLPSAPRELPRRALLGAAASMVAPGLASAFGDVKMPMSNIRYKEVQCNPDKGEMLKGTRATYGLEPRCVEVTAEVTNPENKVLKKAGVFGKVNNVEEVTSVLANAMDGASDNGQFTLVEEIPPGTNDIQFRFVAALPKRYNNKELPELEFYQLKATWYPGAVRWQPLTECDLNPTADGCEEAERFCKDCKNNLSADGKPLFS
ncbi:unnamed protein product [Durusdinium trenchii]|uniref:Uncharacterized protein n=1 Tax=Durusdinium trenchii TaxID=1381693 RepID=A0ABP0LKX5_9DINO